MDASGAVHALIRRFDRWLSQVEGLFVFNDSPDCILRLQVRRAPHAMALGECAIRKGQALAAIHLWSEHLPPLRGPLSLASPSSGAAASTPFLSPITSDTPPDLLWAVRTQRLFVHSLRLAAAAVRQDERLAGLPAIYGATSLFGPQTGPSGIHPMARLGFTVIPYRSPLGAFGEFWENFYALGLIWAYNPGSPRGRKPWDLHRMEMWMGMGDFMTRYG